MAESEQRWRSIVENPFDFVVVIDRSYRYTFVNFVAPGLRAEDLLGKATPFDFVAGDYHAAMRRALEEAFEQGRAGSYDVYVPLIDKWYSSLVGPIREGDAVTHVSILTRDITAEKRIQVQARRTEQRLRLAIEGAQEVLFDRDLETGEAFVAPRIYELLGFAPSEVTIDVFGPGFADWLHPDDREAVLEAHRATLAAGLPFAVEFRLRARSGEHRWFEGRGRVVKEPGEAGHFAGFLTDLTERRARQAELERALDAQRRLETKLTDAAKLEAVGRLAGGIAHDFNNLLTGIGGIASMLGVEAAPDSRLASDVHDLQQSVQRGAGLTRQLLAFSRQQVVAPVLLDLNAHLSGLGRLLARLIGEDIELQVVPGQGVGCVRADPSQIEQVLLNLAVNARDAMPSGGALLIETESVRFDEEYCRYQPEARPGTFVRLCVSDDGVGMAPATIARIFEPFFTTKPVGEGTGLGLATVYGIVRQSGGFIHVYSELGRGTTFKIYLPQVEGEPSHSSRPPDDKPHGTETILVVEDEEVVLRLTRRMLEVLGYTVRTAARGDEALARIESGEAFDLLLTDIILPGLDGHELYRRGRTLRPALPVVFMSGYTDNLISHRGILDEGALFLQKPFTPDALARKVRDALDQLRGASPAAPA